MRLIPQSYRFEAAALLARLAVPLFCLTAAYKQQLTTKVDGPFEITLHFILNALTKYGTKFDPVIAVRGYEEFERSCAAGRGVLVIGPHAALNLLLVRRFHEDGYRPFVISPDPKMRIGGTTVNARTIQPSPTFLVKTRSRLRRGGVVCAMPDRAEHHGKRTIEFDTADGPVILAPALIQVAARCGAHVIFTEVHFEGRKLAGTVAAPPSGLAGTADTLTAEFVKFVQRHVETRFQRYSRNAERSGEVSASPPVRKTTFGSEPPFPRQP